MEENVQVQLSPPWITYFNELKNSIGADSTVTVGPLIPVGGNYIILVHALSNEKARALATLLKSFVQFGNVSVTVIVTNNENEIVNPFPCPLDAFEIAHLFQVALENNPYFEQVVVQPQFPADRMLSFRFSLRKSFIFSMTIFLTYVKRLQVLLPMYFVM